MLAPTIGANSVAEYLKVETQLSNIVQAMTRINATGDSYFTGVVLFSNGDFGYTTVKGDLFLFVTSPLDFFECVKNNRIDEETWMNHLALMYHGPNGLTSYIDEITSFHTHYPHMGISIEREVAAYRSI